MVLRLNQETRAPRLHVPGANHTQRHPTSRPPGHRVPDLCDHLRYSAPGLLLLPRSSSLHIMPHLPSAHHETSKRDSPNETKVKEKQNKTIPDSNSNFAKSMTHHNQTNELTTWFLKLVPTNEEYVQGTVDWLVKDAEAWDSLCEHWASPVFRAKSERARQNRLSKRSVHHYGVDGHVRKVQRMV
jgi:hypothetical protein